MANTTRFTGVSFNNIRKALYLIFFGVDDGKCDTFESPKYNYIVPMQGNFENPMQLNEYDTYVMYWIERDESITQDDYEEDGEDSYDYTKCVATILLRFVGANAEDWAKSFRHLAKRNNITKIWAGVCNAEKLMFTSPIIPRKVDYNGLNSQTAFDLHIKLYYDECISTGWKSLTGIDFTVEDDIHVEDNSN